MGKIIDKIIGNLEEKREYRRTEARAKKLSAEYATAYREIKKYIFHTSGVLTGEPLKVLVDLLEEAAESGQRVVEIIGSDVAAFADELVRGERSYYDEQRKKLNKNFVKKIDAKDK